MTDRLDLPDRYRRKLEALLAEHVPDAEVWAYGSRVSGRSHAASDLDLVLRGPNLEPIPASQLADLEEAFEQSNIPIIVQTHDWTYLPESFHEEIKQRYVVVQMQNPGGMVGTRSTIGEWIPFSYGKGLPKHSRQTGGSVPVYGSNGIIGHHDTALTGGPTVIIGRKGNVGTVHFSSRPCWPIDTTFFVEDRDPEIARYKYYMLKSLGLNHMNSDSAVPGLNRNQAHATEVQIPPMASQRSVSQALGTLDDKIELNRHMSRTLEELAQAIFKSWFVNFDSVHAKAEGRPSGLPSHLDALFPDRLTDSAIGLIPDGWTVGQYREIVNQIRDTVDPRIYSSESFTYYSLPAFDSNQTPIVEYGRSIKSHKLLVYQDTVLVSRLNPNIERVWLVDVANDQRAICSTEFLVIRPVPPFSKGYIYCLARSKPFQDQLQSLVTGTSKSHQRVPTAAILSTVTLIPPKPIAVAFGDLSESLLGRSLACRKQAYQLSAIRDTLLPRLLSGRPSLGII